MDVHPLYWLDDLVESVLAVLALVGGLGLLGLALAVTSPKARRNRAALRRRRRHERTAALPRLYAVREDLTVDRRRGA